MLSPLGSIALCTLITAASGLTIGPTAQLTIANRNVTPDGYRRSATLADGTFPGPTITGKKGDRFRLNVVNQLNDTSMLTSTSVHWHGIFQHGTNFADGTSYVTQCPIDSGNSFLYDFNVQSQAGTFWYHSHLSTQYCDGLRGAFVIYDPQCPYKSLYDVDDESTIITLADWYHDPASSLLPHGQVPPFSLSTLINGKGRYTGGPLVPLSVISVQSAKRYRFRIIAMSCDPGFDFSFDRHSLTIIEADGEYTQPLVVDSLTIYAGQRYSVILAANQPVGNYWIRANPSRGYPGFDQGRNSAILRYVGASKVDPTSSSKPINPMKEVNLHALVDPVAPGLPVPGGADYVLNLAMAFNFTSFRFTMNGASYTPPTIPVLLQILSGVHNAQDLLPAGSVYSLPPNKVIEISLPGTGALLGGPHPFHLHGHSFYVVRSGDSETYNYLNPVRRDTVNTGLADGNATIRFVTDNAGPWFLHCHIDWHLELGLAVVFAADIKEIAHKDPVPESWEKLCKHY